MITQYKAADPLDPTSQAEYKLLAGGATRTWVGTEDAYNAEKNNIPNNTMICITDDNANREIPLPDTVNAFTPTWTTSGNDRTWVATKSGQISMRFSTVAKTGSYDPQLHVYLNSAEIYSYNNRFSIDFKTNYMFTVGEGDVIRLTQDHANDLINLYSTFIPWKED